MKRLLRIFSVVALFTGICTQAIAQAGSGLPEHWQAIPEIPIGTVNAAAFSIGTRAYVIGGDTSGEFGVRKKYSKDVYRYDSTTNSWTKMSPFPGKARVGAVAFSVGNIGYYGLGMDTTGFFDSITLINDPFDPFDDTRVGYYRLDIFADWWKYEPGTDTWTQLNDLYTGYTFASPFVMRNGSTRQGGFAFGMSYGANRTKYEYSDFLYLYNDISDTWTAVPTNIGPRANAVAIPTDDNRLMIGMGDNDQFDVYLNDWYEYDKTAGVITPRAPFPSFAIPPKGKVNVGTFNTANYCYVVCGFDGTWSKSFYEYDRVDDVWQRYPDYRDSGRANGVSWMIGNMGYYGAGFRPLSEELATFSKFFLDTATIRFSPVDPLTYFQDTICASSEIEVGWSAGKTFLAGNTLKVQMSDSLGLYTWPPSPTSIIGEFAATGNNGTLIIKLPDLADEGRLYRIRLIGNNPDLLGRSSPSFFFKSNPLFSYRPSLHPLQDTACENSDFLIPMFVKGTARNSEGELSYQWLFEGNPIHDGVSYSGTKTDSLVLKQAQLNMSGRYELVAFGDCYPDTSLPFDIVVDIFPAPVLTFQPGDTIPTKRTAICEFAPYKLRVAATGKNLNFEWYHNGDSIPLKGNIIGKRTENLTFAPILGRDSGWYKVKVYEDCGAYTFSDSFFVEVREIARIHTNPVNAKNILEGDTAGFRVKATGYDLKYVWRSGLVPLASGGRFQGIDTDSLTVVNVKYDDVAFYSVEVTGGCLPSVVSNLAILDVIASARVERQPRTNLDLCEGASGSINILASGSNLTYLWKRNGALINYSNFSGQTTRTLSFTNIQVNQSGNYACTVDNGVGSSVTSDNCVINVKPRPAKPVINKMFNGNLVCLTAGADDYLWFYNDRYNPDFSGPTKQQITVPDSLEGDWSVRIIVKGCISEISDRFAYVTAITDLKMVYDLDLYPNPAVNNIRVELSDITSPVVDVQVYDLSGKLVIVHKNMDTENIDLNISALTAGMYVVRIHSNEKVYAGKFIKQ